MIFTDVISEFADKIGIGPLNFDRDGSVALLFDGEHEINFTPDAEDRSVLFHAEVGDSSRLDRDGCLRLLKASLLGAETGGASFAVHEAPGKVVLWKRYDDAFEDCAALENAVNAFIAQVIFWKEQLSTGAADSSADQALGLPPGFLGLRV